MKELILSVLILTCNCIYGQKLDLLLETEKMEYLQYEPINIRTTIKNMDAKSIEIQNFYYRMGDLEFLIYNKYGTKLIQFEDVRIDGGIPPIYELKPGEEIYKRTSLLYYADQNVLENQIKSNTSFLKPGNYTIQIKYNLDNDQSNKKYKSILSNKRKITISEPTSDDRKGIIKDLKKVKRLRYGKQNKYKKSIELVLNIIEKYKKHPLTKIAYSYLDYSNLKYHNYDLDKYDKQFCYDFPNSFRSINIASTIIEKDAKFKKKIEGTNLYKNTLKIIVRKNNMKNILTRDKRNSRIIQLMEKNNIN